MLAISTAFTSCSDDKGNGLNDDGSTVVLPDSRVYILNEGSYNGNNSNITFYAPNGDYNSTNVIDDIFNLQNDAKLGDTGQSMIVYGNSVYVAVYGSNYLVKLNSACVEEARVSFTSDSDLSAGIRYIAADGGYIYASFYGGAVAKINATTLKVESKLTGLGGNLEGVAIANGNLYIANSYSYTATGYEYYNNLVVVDLNKFAKTGTLTVSENPNDLISYNNKLYLISYAVYNSTDWSVVSNAAFQVVDPSTSKYTKICDASKMAVGNGKVYLLNSDTDWNTYQTVNSFFSYDIASATLSTSSFLTNAPSALSSSNIYMMSVNPNNGDIYIGTTDYYSNGEIYRFTKDGSYVGSFSSGGVNPSTAVYFN